MEKQKILIFSIAYTPLIGGAEVAVKEITDRLPEYDFDLVCARIKKNLPSYEKIGNVNVYRVGIGVANIDKYFFPFLGCFKALFLSGKNKPWIIWAIMANYAGMAALFFKFLKPKIPYLLTLQEGDPIEHIRKKIKFIYRQFQNIFKKASYIQAISNFLANWAKEEGATCPIEVVPNAVDIKRFSQIYSSGELQELKNKLKIEKEEKVIITTSRLVLKNGVNDLIKAGEYLDFPFKILVLGIGPDEKKLKNLVTELRFENKILFLGQVDHQEMVKYLKISDIFCRPSLSEGLGNSFLEAMVAGLPVIGTPVGGIPDFLEDGKTGLFCQPKNPKSIADKIKLLLSDDNLRQNIIENGCNLVKEKYDWNIVAEQMNKIFSHLV